MSVIIFIVVTILSDIVISSFDHSQIGTDHIIFALSILIGLGSAIWFCLTRDKLKQIIEGVRDGIHGNSGETNTENSKDE